MPARVAEEEIAGDDERLDQLSAGVLIRGAAKAGGLKVQPLLRSPALCH
jgi:hypothetical protein